MKIGIVTHNVEMVTTDDGGHIPAQYQEFLEVFSKEKAETLQPHSTIDHTIKLEPQDTLPYTRIYNVSEFELTLLKAYIEMNWTNSFIEWSPSSAEAPILFVQNKFKGVRLCVDYHGRNLGTVDNTYPSPLI